MKKIVLAALAATVALTGCETYVTPRYSISADNNVALKSLGSAGLAVGDFSGPAQFDPNCRAVGPLEVPDNMTHAQYIRKALEDELKVAGLYAAGTPRRVLTGQLTNLEFSSSQGITRGYWQIDLTLNSSNGRSMKASERYEFASGFIGPTACKQTAEAFSPAVQDLIGKIVRSGEFADLVK
jgi:hypothetical protein